MFGVVPISMGRRYSAPGASGTAARQRSITLVTISATSAAAGSGSSRLRALWRKRSMWRSMRNTCTLPSAHL